MDMDALQLDSSVQALYHDPDHMIVARPGLAARVLLSILPPIEVFRLWDLPHVQMAAL